MQVGRCGWLGGMQTRKQGKHKNCDPTIEPKQPTSENIWTHTKTSGKPSDGNLFSFFLSHTCGRLTHVDLSCWGFVNAQGASCILQVCEAWRNWEDQRGYAQEGAMAAIWSQIWGIWGFSPTMTHGLSGFVETHVKGSVYPGLSKNISLKLKRSEIGVQMDMMDTVYPCNFRYGRQMDLETSLWPSWSAWVFTPSMGNFFLESEASQL